MKTIIVTSEEIIILRAGSVEHRYPTPAGLLGDPTAELPLCREFNADVLILDRFPEPDEPVQDDSGWRTLTTVNGTGTLHYHIGYLPLLRQKDTLLNTTDPWWLDTIIDRLNRWRAGTGVDYHTHPAVSAVVSMKANVHKRPRWMLRAAGGDWWEPPGQITDLRHELRTTPRTPYVSWDRRAAYLASAAAVELPYQALRNTGTMYDDCGYYRVRIDTSVLGRYFRSMLSHAGDASIGATWVCHPTLRVLAETGTLVDILDSYTTTEHSRILRPWAERWRDMLMDAPAGSQLRAAAKRGYAQALGGLFNVRAGTIFRPDWRHMIIDHNRAHILRIIARMWQFRQILPDGIDVDCITYAGEPSDTLDEIVGVGPRIGNMRTVNATVLDNTGAGRLVIPAPAGLVWRF